MKTRSYIKAVSPKKIQKPSRKQTAGRLKTKKPVKASRVKLPPPEVGRLIELANMLPDDYLYLQDLRDETAGSPHELEKLILREVERFPGEIRNFLRVPDGISSDMSIEEIYEILTETDREPLQERYQYLTDGKTLLDVIAVHQSRGSARRFGWQAFSCSVYWYEDLEGKLQVALSPLVSVMRDVEINRIRNCHACNKIFWAGRGNQKVCCEACGHVLRNRRYRKNYIDRYKLQRIQSENRREKEG